MTKNHSLTGSGAFVDDCRLFVGDGSGTARQRHATFWGRWDAECQRAFWLELVGSSSFDVRILRFSLVPLAKWEEVGGLVWNANPICGHFASEVESAGCGAASPDTSTDNTPSIATKPGVYDLSWPGHVPSHTESRHCACIVPRMNDMVCVTPQFGHNNEEGLLYLVVRAGSEPGKLSIVRAEVGPPSLGFCIREARLDLIHYAFAELVTWEVKIDVINFMAVCYAVLCKHDAEQQRRRSKDSNARLYA